MVSIGRAFPTPRQILSNENVVNVRYVEDRLAQLLEETTLGVFDPNPNWFALPSTSGPNPVPSSSPSSLPTDSPAPSPSPPSCKVNKESCSDPSECCSNNCRNGSCKGNCRRLNQGKKPSFGNPRAQELWDLLVNVQGKPPVEAIREIVKDTCGPQNPLMATPEWIAQSALPEDLFRCFPV